jgi:hypothetical protein
MFARKPVRRRFIGLFLKCSILDFFYEHAQTSSPSSPGFGTSADYFRGRSFTK